ncbi:hypothetical protein Q3G72_033840 [Acer saccharum]|nr:hypothetical protein Q3G72_033840 [Acer saccharum]
MPLPAQVRALYGFGSHSENKGRRVGPCDPSSRRRAESRPAGFPAGHGRYCWAKLAWRESNPHGGRLKAHRNVLSPALPLSYTPLFSPLARGADRGRGMPLCGPKSGAYDGESLRLARLSMWTALSCNSSTPRTPGLIDRDGVPGQGGRTGPQSVCASERRVDVRVRVGVRARLRVLRRGRRRLPAMTCARDSKCTGLEGWTCCGHHHGLCGRTGWLGGGTCVRVCPWPGTGSGHAVAHANVGLPS